MRSNGKAQSPIENMKRTCQKTNLYGLVDVMKTETGEVRTPYDNRGKALVL